MTDPIEPAHKSPTGSPDAPVVTRATAREQSRGWHALDILLKTVWIGLGVLAVLAVLLVARIAAGPISLGPVAPMLKAGFAHNGEDMQLAFEDGTVAWLARNEMRTPGEKKRLLPGFEFRLKNLQLQQENRTVLKVPEARLTLSSTALLQASIAPSRIELSGLKVNLNWTKGDVFSALGGEGDGLGSVLSSFMNPPDRSSSMGFLQVISVRNADIHLEEAITNSNWHVRNAMLSMKRSDRSVNLAVNGALQRRTTDDEVSQTTPLSLRSELNYKAPTSTVYLDFKDFNPRHFAGNSEFLTRLKVADTALSGDIGLTFKREGDAELHSIAANLTAGPGVLTLEDLYPAPISLDGATFKGQYDLLANRLDLDSAIVKFSGAELRAQGQVLDDPRGLGIRLGGTLTNLPLSQLKTYWPEKFGTGAYKWVQANLDGGQAKSANFKLNITPDMWDRTEGLPASALDLKFVFEDVTAHYLRPMPPITKGMGEAHLTLHNFLLTTQQGEVSGVKLKDSTIRFDDIHLSGAAKAHADIELHGLVPDVLAVIDHEPLGYPSAYGMTPGSVLGSSITSLSLNFPLVQAVTLNDVEFEVQSTLTNVQVAELFTDVGLQSDKLTVTVTPQQLVGQGLIKLNELPLSLEWVEDFLAGKGNLSSRFKLQGRIEGEQWNILSLPFADFIKGPADVDFNLRGAGPSIRRGEGRIDFKDASLGFRDIGWWKAAGQPSEAKFKFAKPSADRLTVQDIVYVDNDMRASGSLATSSERGLERMVVDSLKVGRSMLAATITRPHDDEYDVALTAATLDSSFYINRLLYGKTIPGAASDGRGEDDGFKLPNFTLDGFAAELYALDGVVTRNVEVKAKYADDRWGNTTVTGDYAKGGNFNFSLEAPVKAAQSDQPRRSFTLLSTNAGETTRGIGLLDTAVGGVLTASGTMTEPGDDQRVQTSVEARDFRLINAPILTKILTIGSLTGIRDILSGEGVTFERATVPIIFDHGILRINDARAWGAAIGVTVNGELGIESKRVAFGGTIVPSYTANNVLGQLPIIGNLIMGGEGRGLFAFTYSVTGAADNPDVSVNPLSVLAPGFLRWIFEPNPRLKRNGDKAPSQ